MVISTEWFLAFITSRHSNKNCYCPVCDHVPYNFVSEAWLCIIRASTSSHCWLKTSPASSSGLSVGTLLNSGSSSSSRSLWALSVHSNRSEWVVAESVVVYFFDLIFPRSIHLCRCRAHMFGQFTNCPIYHLCCSQNKTGPSVPQRTRRCGQTAINMQPYFQIHNATLDIRK